MTARPSTQKYISTYTTEEALRDAARAAFLVVGAYPEIDLPADYGPRRQLFHSLTDAVRRSMLLQLLTEEGERLHRDSEASFTQRVRRAGVVDRGDSTTDARRPRLSGDPEPEQKEGG